MIFLILTFSSRIRSSGFFDFIKYNNIVYQSGKSVSLCKRFFQKIFLFFLFHGRVINKRLNITFYRGNGCFKFMCNIRGHLLFHELVFPHFSYIAENYFKAFIIKYYTLHPEKPSVFCNLIFCFWQVGAIYFQNGIFFNKINYLIKFRYLEEV